MQFRINKTARRKGIHKAKLPPMPKTIPNARNITGEMLKTGKVPKLKKLKL